jgi:3'(2'), 5'-bisphosphate nucleotidase
MKTEELLITAINASLKAGVEILNIYNSDFAVQQKEDKSPLTLADKNANDVISKILEVTKLPILSEEGKTIPYAERINWEYFWMVDPLDGTKEFVKRNGEFTVNIALIHQQRTILGVIYVPVTNILYFAAEGIGSYKLKVESNELNIENLSKLISTSQKLPIQNSDQKYTVVASRSHLSEETEQFIAELKKIHAEVELVSSGSSLKLCLVAEGSANVYPRFAPTMEWDTAAGQAICEIAKKSVMDYTTKNALLYNKENLLNNWFIVE